MNQYVNEFTVKYRSKVKEWKLKLEKIVNKGKRVLIWGGGSKGVTFMNTLNIQDEIKYVVDINPRKQGMFIPGTGQRIILSNLPGRRRAVSIISGLLVAAITTTSSKFSRPSISVSN